MARRARVIPPGIILEELISDTELKGLIIECIKKCFECSYAPSPEDVILNLRKNYSVGTNRLEVEQILLLLERESKIRMERNRNRADISIYDLGAL